MIVKGIDSMIIRSSIAVFEPINENISLWSDLGIWYTKHSRYYSKWLKQQIPQLKFIIKEYKEKGFSSKIAEKFSLDNKFLRKLAYGIASTQNIHDALLYAKGKEGRLGLELAMAELREYYDINKKLPPTNGLSWIRNSCQRKEWQAFGISTWNDLLRETLGKIFKNQNKYKGNEGFETAVQELRESKEELGRMPNSNDEGMRAIFRAVFRGEWIDRKIKTWNDLLLYVFNKVNFNANKYRGKKGLETAIRELRDFETKEERLPNYRDIPSGIHSAIKRGEWKQFGIVRWSALKKYVFGEEATKKVTRIKRKPSKSKGDMLNEAIYEMKAFKNKNNRFPTSKELRKYARFSQSGIWSELGIEGWKDMLKYVFGITSRSKYDGEIAFSKAIDELKSFRDKNGKLPTSKEMIKIRNVILSKIWVKFGITSWNDMMWKVFGTLNR